LKGCTVALVCVANDALTIHHCDERERGTLVPCSCASRRRAKRLLRRRRFLRTKIRTTKTSSYEDFQFFVQENCLAKKGARGLTRAHEYVYLKIFRYFLIFPDVPGTVQYCIPYWYLSRHTVTTTSYHYCTCTRQKLQTARQR
jgi:hypothetical protein